MNGVIHGLALLALFSPKTLSKTCSANRAALSQSPSRYEVIHGLLLVMLVARTVNGCGKEVEQREAKIIMVSRICSGIDSFAVTSLHLTKNIMQRFSDNRSESDFHAVQMSGGYRNFKCDTKSLVEVVSTLQEGTARVTG